MVRICKGGRPRLDGERELHGRLLRYPSGDLRPREDFGMDELRWRKNIAAGNDTLKKVVKRGFAARNQKPGQRDDTDLSPLGILLARKLISDRQHAVAMQFVALHGQVFTDAPKLQGNAMLSALPSAPSGLDVPRMPFDELEKLEGRRDRYNRIKAGLSLPQMETVQSLVINRSITRTDVRVFLDIVTLNITGREMLCVTGSRAPIHVQRRVDAIRNALNRLRGPRRTAWAK